MSEQDGTQSLTKQRRSRKTSIDNQQNSKQTSTTQRPANYDREAWEAFWREQGQPWRTEPEIDTERQKYLTERRAIMPDIELGIYPFKDIEPKLTRADVEWLLATHENGRGPIDWSDESQRGRIGVDLRGAELDNIDLNHLPLARMRGGLTVKEWPMVTIEQRKLITIHLQKANLVGAHLQEADIAGAQLQEADLREAHMQKANLVGAHLQKADLGEAQLPEANLMGAHLQKANLVYAQMQKAYLWHVQMQEADLRNAQMQEAYLYQAQLQKANLREAHMQKAILWHAQMQEANLPETQLQEANLWQAHMQKTDLWQAHMQKAYLVEAKLQGADLRRAELDHATLDQVTFSDKENGSARFADISWGDVNLAVVDWKQVKMLGDELQALKDENLDSYQSAVRAYRQLTTVLRNQGLGEEADVFAYQAHVLQQKVIQLQVYERSRKKKYEWIVKFSELLDRSSLRKLGVFISVCLLSLIFIVASIKNLPIIVAQVASIILFLIVVFVLFVCVRNPIVRLLTLIFSQWYILFLIHLLFIAPFIALLYLLIGKPLLELISRIPNYQFWVVLIPSILILLLVQLNRFGKFDSRTVVIRTFVKFGNTYRNFYLYFYLLGPLLKHIFGDSMKYIFFSFLDKISGFGYRPWNSIKTYAIVIFVFGILYFTNIYFFVDPQTNIALAFFEGIITSITAFHGRGFLFDQLNPSIPIASIAAFEAIVGLVIEISFIATFTQRFFGK
jgi:uncharacterized protein YjbI with pentapeptide repeats